MSVGRADRVLHGLVGTAGQLRRLSGARRLGLANAMTLMLAVIVAPSACASNAINVEVGPDPTVGVPLSVTVFGQEGGGSLYVNVQGGGCAHAAPRYIGPYGEDASKTSAWEEGHRLGVTELGEGAFSKTYSLTPSEAGPFYICAYMVAGPTAERPEEASETGEAPMTVGEPPIRPLTALKVTARSHNGSTATKPGETELLVTVTSGAYVSLVVKYQRRTDKDSGGGGAESKVAFAVPWSCSAPSAIYTYTVTAYEGKESRSTLASQEGGRHLTRTGKFRGVSAARCRVLRADDKRRRSAEARERDKREERRRRESRETEHEDERVRSDQRGYCEQVLGGHVEQVFNGNMIPAIPSEIETECSAHGHNYTLRGDPPVVVRVT